MEHESKKRLKKKEEEEMSNSLQKDLSSLPICFSDKSKMKVEGNKIIHNGNDGCETCIIGTPMLRGVYKITFDKISDDCSFGVINGSIKDVESGKSISQSNAGVEIYIDDKDVSSFEKSMNDYVNNVRRVFNLSKEIGKISLLSNNILIFNSSHKFIEGYSQNTADSNISIELDLRSDDPNERNAYFYIDGCPLSTYFSGLPSLFHFGVCIFLFI